MRYREALDRLGSCALATVLVLAGLVGGCQRPTLSNSGQQAGSAAKKSAKVSVGVVREQLLEKSVELPATIESDETAMLMARVQAYVGEVLVDIGDEVKAGQVLVRLDALEIQHNSTQQRAVVQEIRAEKRVLQAELGAARSQLDVIRAELNLKSSERERLSRLVSTGAIERQRLEEADSSVQSSSAMLARYENDVKVAEAKLLKGESEMAVAEAKLQAAETFASYLEIKAPFAGIVVKRNVDVGALVRPASQSDGSKPLLTIAKVDKLRAIVHATVDIAGQLVVGGQVQFVADDMPDTVFTGQLSRTAGSYDEKTRMMRAEIDFDNSLDPATGRRPLRAGTYGTATIVTDTKTLPVVPESALRRIDSATSVVVVRDGVCHITPVEVALERDGLVGIASGIAAGDQVVTENPHAIQPQQTLSDVDIKLVTW